MSKGSRIPPKIKVGTHEYIVKCKPIPKHGKKEVSGLCDTEGLEILIGPRFKRTRKQQILLHELCHTLTTTTKVPLEHEEEMVELISEGLLQIIQDNPKLVEYLQKR